MEALDSFYLVTLTYADKKKQTHYFTQKKNSDTLFIKGYLELKKNQKVLVPTTSNNNYESELGSQQRAQ